MNIKSKMIVGGLASMLGNEEQTRYALFKFFSEDFYFFHQHVTEDIELHQTDGIKLIQVKRSQDRPSDIARALRSYLEKHEFVSFVLKNKADIKMWEWVSDVKKTIKIEDVMKLMNVEDVLDDKGEIITSKSEVQEFLELFESKFVFVKAGWISNSTKATKKIFGEMASFNPGPNINYVWKDRTRDYLMEQLKNLERMESIDVQTFKTLRLNFLEYSKKNILDDVRNHKEIPLSNDTTYKTLYELYGMVEANAIINSASKKYVNDKIRGTSITEEMIEKLKKELT